jgi:hypothetical protein
VLRLRAGLEELLPALQRSNGLDAWSDLPESQVHYQGPTGTPGAGEIAEHAWLYIPPAEAVIPTAFFRFRLRAPSE